MSENCETSQEKTASGKILCLKETYKGTLGVKFKFWTSCGLVETFFRRTDYVKLTSEIETAIANGELFINLEGTCFEISKSLLGSIIESFSYRQSQVNDGHGLKNSVCDTDASNVQAGIRTDDTNGAASSQPFADASPRQFNKPTQRFSVNLQSESVAEASTTATDKKFAPVLKSESKTQGTALKSLAANLAAKGAQFNGQVHTCGNRTTIRIKNEQ